MDFQRAAVIAALVLMAVAAPAQEDSVFLTVQGPAGAEVWLMNATEDGQDSRLGPTNEALPLAPRRLRDEVVRLEVRRPWYRTAPLEVPTKSLVSDGEETVPKGGPLQMQPSPGLWAAWIGGALLLAGLPAAFLLHRARRHQAAAEDAATRLERMVVGSASEDPLLGKRIGDYWVLEKIGTGGMGVVYRGVSDAELQAAGRLDQVEGVALKLLDPEASKDPEFLERFRREVAISRSLRHPSIVRLDDFGEHLGRHYLVMELVRGETMRSRVDPGGLPAREALELLEPVGEALAYAHEKGIVHRDLKPDNVMVSGSRVLVMDFGLARGHDYPTVTKTSTLLGTPQYMAPEQIVKGQLGPSIDQYALGVMAFELLTGRLPFDADDPVQVIFRHLSEDPPSLRDLQPEADPEVAAVVARMLAKEPADRYPDVAAAVAALRGAILKEGPSTRARAGS